MPVTSPPAYLFAGGGTGGHLFPGIAVAEELRRRQPNCRVLFVGSEREVEQKIIAASGFPHVSLPVEPLAATRHHPFRFLARNWSAWRESRRLIHHERPAAVIGLGGLASVPLVLAAGRQCPVILLEQNVLAGNANRVLARRARAVCVSFEESRGDLPRAAQVVVTGNPVRDAIASLARSLQARTNHQPLLLILGGSQGARTLNETVSRALPEMADALRGWRVVHQTGALDFETVREAYRSSNVPVTVAPFFDDMLSLYAEARMALSRAGATTLAELACAGCPTILFPYRHAARDHQRRNAEIAAAAGAAEMILESEDPAVSSNELAARLSSLIIDDERRESMSRAMRKLSRPDAAAAVANVIDRLSMS